MHYLERLRMQWSAAATMSPKRLTLRATDDSGTVVRNAEIPIPN